MNENEFINNNTNTYKATRNLNTEIENPQININSAVGINIQDLPENNVQNNMQNNDTIDRYFNVDLNQPTPTPINNEFQNTNSYNDINYNNQNTNSFEQNNFNNNNNNNNTFINQTTTQNQENNTTTFINNDLMNNSTSYSNDYEEQDNISNTTTNYTPTGNTTHYQPTLKEKHKKESLKMPSELKVTIFIVLLLLLFISVMPYIFDFFKTIELTLFG